MLPISPEEFVTANFGSGIQCVEVVVGVRGRQCCFQTEQTGIGNGSGRQTLVKIGVICFPIFTFIKNLAVLISPV